MATYFPSEVLLLSFPFSNTITSKRRPALVLANTGDEDIVVARITSQIYQTPFDVQLKEWKTAGLMLPSVVRVHKLATLQKNLVERRLGQLTPSDWSNVRAAILQLWQSDTLQQFQIQNLDRSDRNRRG